MPRIDTQELLSRLEKGKPIPALVLLGDEPYLRDTCRAKLIERFVPEAARTWALSRYSAERGETEAALGQAQSLPMLSPTQVVFLENAEAIEKLGDRSREETVEILEKYLDDPAPFTTLVIEAASLDERMKLAKSLAAKSLVVSVGLGENPEQRQATAVVMAHNFAGELGLKFEKGAAEELAERVSADLMRLKSEIDKLANYIGDNKRITSDDVAAMVASEKSTTVWELADLLASRQAKRSLEFLDRLLRDGEEPVAMVGAMTWMYRKLVEASEIKGAMNGWQAARVLGMRPEQADLALRAARKSSKAQLLSGLQALEKADDRLKSSKDARTVMEFLVAELTGAKVVVA
jgi:DNA polymerase III subunit delta